MVLHNRKTDAFRAYRCHMRMPSDSANERSTDPTVAPWNRRSAESPAPSHTRLRDGSARSGSAGGPACRPRLGTAVRPRAELRDGAGGSGSSTSDPPRTARVRPVPGLVVFRQAASPAVERASPRPPLDSCGVALPSRRVAAPAGSNSDRSVLGGGRVPLVTSVFELPCWFGRMEWGRTGTDPEGRGQTRTGVDRCAWARTSADRCVRARKWSQAGRVVGRSLSRWRAHLGRSESESAARVFVWISDPFERR